MYSKEVLLSLDICGIALRRSKKKKKKKNGKKKRLGVFYTLPVKNVGCYGLSSHC
jgi:hypothetical protein